MTGNNGFRVPDPFERSYGGAAPWEQDRCTTCAGTGKCEYCDTEGEGCLMCEGTAVCGACDGEGHA